MLKVFDRREEKMKKLNILKKSMIAIVSLSLLFLFCLPIKVVNAYSENEIENIEPKWVEQMTFTADQGLGGDMGYVTCKAVVNYNHSTKTYTLVSVSVTPHFSASQPLLTMIGTPTSTPSAGSKVTNYVTVHYKFGIMFTGNEWSKSCTIYL